jgi:HK97 family phage major capsid protein
MSVKTKLNSKKTSLSQEDHELAMIRKADLTIQNLLDDSGALPAEMANTFLRKIMDQVTIFNEVRQIAMSRNEMRIPTIASAGRMLRVARNMYSSVRNGDQTGLDAGYGAPNRGLSKAERARVQTGIITLKTDELIAVMYLTYELLEDVIEGGAIDNTAFQSIVLDIMAQQIALDLEVKLVMGDTTSMDDFLALQNGMLKFAQSNIVNQNDAPINHMLFAEMLKSLPERYRNRLSTYKFFVNSNVEIDYRAQLAQRQTGLGDGMLSGTTPVSIMGVPMVKTGAMPTNTIILTDPSNILFGVQRRFRLATERDEENRLIKIVVTMRVGQGVEQEDMMVKAINVGTFI